MVCSILVKNVIVNVVFNFWCDFIALILSTNSVYMEYVGWYME